jgi:hypothetical protein
MTSPDGSQWGITVDDDGVVQGSGIDTHGNVVEVDLDTRSLSLADSHKYLRCSNAGGCVISIPLHASVEWLLGSTIYIRRCTGAGPISFAVTGVTVNDNNVASIAAGSVFAIKNVGVDSWDFI